MTARGMALRALRSRRAQSGLLLVLSVVAIAACAAGPMYERAVEEAAVRSQLAGVSASDRGVVIEGASADDVRSYQPTGADRRLFGPPVAGVEAKVSVVAGKTSFQAPVAGRDDICGHLQLTAGSCPSAGAQVLVSSSSAQALHLAVGDTLQLTGLGGSAPYRIGAARIAGLYQPFDAAGSYWFDHDYSSVAGVRRVSQGDAIPDLLVSDALFVTPAGVQFLQAAHNSANQGLTSPFSYTLDLPVSARHIGVDESAELLGALNRIQARIDAAHPAGDPEHGQVQSELTALLHAADTGRHQTRLIIPTLAVQLALVVLVVLGLVLAVGVDQRRAEIGLARLRGRSRRGAARMFVGEVAVVVLAAFVPGLALAWIGCAALAAAWLPAGTPTQLRWPVLVAAVAVAVVELGLAVVLARRTAAQPISQLLRSVGPQRSGTAVTAAEVGLGVAAVAGVVVALTGDHHSALALVAPSLIAILAGLILSRVLLAVTRRVGARALWRGRLSLGLAALQTARRPGIRRVVTLVCVAVALLLSAVDQHQVAATNRAGRAAADIGAPVVLDVSAENAAQLRTAVKTVDPSGNFATPVLIQRPDGGDTPVIAVDHSRFPEIARWGSARDTPSRASMNRLVPAHPPAPIQLSGDLLQLRTDRVSVTSDDPDSRVMPLPISLSFDVELPSGASTDAIVPIRSSTAAVTTTVRLGGCAQGCVLRRIEVLRAIGDYTAAKVSMRLLGLAAGTAAALRPVPLGQGGDWQNSDAAAAAAGTAASIDLRGSPLVLEAVSHGTGATLQHLDVPTYLPCLVAGAVSANSPSGAADSVLSIHGIDGGTAGCQPSGTIAFAPRFGAGTVLVDLDLSIASTQPVLTNTSAQVWLAADDPHQEAALIAGLAGAGITVTGRSTIAHAQSSYDQSPPAWAIRAALAAAVLAAVIAGLMVVIAAFTSEASRSYDLAALQLIGIRRSWIHRSVLGEQLVAVLFAGVVGAAVGLAGARLALPAVPLFIDQPAVPAPRYDVPWTPVLIALGALAGLLVLAAVISAFVIEHRIGPDRLREGA